MLEATLIRWLESCARQHGCCFITAVPVLAILLFGGGFLLSLFGEEFRAGHLALSILVVGQFVSVVSGPVGNLLQMTGNERVFLGIVGRYGGAKRDIEHSVDPDLWHSRCGYCERCDTERQQYFVCHYREAAAGLPALVQSVATPTSINMNIDSKGKQRLANLQLRFRSLRDAPGCVRCARNGVGSGLPDWPGNEDQWSCVCEGDRHAYHW